MMLYIILHCGDVSVPLTCHCINRQNRAFSVAALQLGIGCRRNSRYCDCQRHSDKNLRQFCSGKLTELRALLF